MRHGFCAICHGIFFLVRDKQAAVFHYAYGGQQLLVGRGQTPVIRRASARESVQLPGVRVPLIEVTYAGNYKNKIGGEFFPFYALIARSLPCPLVA